MEETVKISPDFIAQYKKNMPSSIVKGYATYLDKKEVPKKLIIAYYQLACCVDYKDVMRAEFPFLKDM